MAARAVFFFIGQGKKTSYRSSAECFENGSLASTESSVDCSSPSHWTSTACSCLTLSLRRSGGCDDDDGGRGGAQAAAVECMAPPLPSWTIIWPCQESSKMTQRGLECEKGDPRSSWSQEREKERERKKEGDRECRRSPSNLSPPFRSGNPDAPSRGFLGLSPLERISARQCWTLRSRRKHERKAHGASKGALAPRRNFFVNSILLSLFFLPSLHFQVRSFPHRHHQQQQFSPRPRRSARSASWPGGPTRTRRDRGRGRRECDPGPEVEFFFQSFLKFFHREFSGSLSPPSFLVSRPEQQQQTAPKPYYLPCRPRARRARACRAASRRWLRASRARRRRA